MLENLQARSGVRINQLIALLYTKPVETIYIESECVSFIEESFKSQ
jgi:hypothetical protein